MPYPFDPSSATVWTLVREDKVASCDVSFVPIGVEARIMRNGTLLYARTFPTGDETLAWAAGERQDLLEKGWRTAEPPTTRLRSSAV
jgi:hypothetical protein